MTISQDIDMIRNTSGDELLSKEWFLEKDPEVFWMKKTFTDKAVCDKFMTEHSVNIGRNNERF